ncbi:hypothetical protein Bbelb_302330 [Branchiostoma belcheri]|nr:hypothetical protein Bbelb_302330 [Branchiostoma belcheri]
MNGQGRAVRSPVSGPDSPQSSGPPEPRPVQQSGSRGRVHHGNGASDQQREDQDTSSHTYEDVDGQKRYATQREDQDTSSHTYEDVDGQKRYATQREDQDTSSHTYEDVDGQKRYVKSAATQKLREVHTAVSVCTPVRLPGGVSVISPEFNSELNSTRAPLTKRRRDLIVRTPRGTPPVAGIPPGHISYVTDQMNRIKPMPARLLNPAGASRGYIPDGHRRATPIRQPEPYWRSRADAAAKILNPVYPSNAGTTPMQQPKSLRSRADAAAKMINPIYASGSADPPMDQPQTDHQARANDDENAPEVTYATIPDDAPMDQPQARANDDENTPDATIPDGAYPGGASGCRGVCSFLRARRSWLAPGIAVLLSLCAVGLAPLTFSNKQEISQLSTTVKRNTHQLDTIVNALKCDQGDMCKLSDTVDVLKSYQDDMRQLSTAVDALKLDLDNERNRSATLEQRLLKIDKSSLCPESYTMWRGTCYKAFDTTKSFSDAAAACRADAFGGTLAMPRDAYTNAFLISLYKSVDDCPFWFGLHDQREEGRFEWVDGTALGPYNSWGQGRPDNEWGNQDCVVYSGLENEKDKWNDEECHDTFRFICQAAPVFCPSWYIIWRGTCYKAFNTVKTFSDAAAACRADGGTLAMPRDADTNAFLISLYKSVEDCPFWFGLHDQREEGRFEWVDGSALGPYNSWGQGRPDNDGGNQDCVVYSGLKFEKDKWNDEECHKTFRFICQAAPVEMYEQAEPVRSPFSGPDSRQISGPPPQPRPVRQSGSRGHARHGNGASDKHWEDQDTSSHSYEDVDGQKRYAASAGNRRFSDLSFTTARIRVERAAAVVSVVTRPSDVQQQTDNMRQLFTTVDALKSDQDTLKRDQDGMSTAVDALKRDQDDMSTAVDALKRDQDDMSTAVDALKRDQDDMSTAVDALKRDQDRVL